ncbi:helix-turn-helix domain-containing protein [Pseudacidovorax intermedius]|uniref:helix-turn-helix domain-containing protein n=1 Tax=Pseudacidovorax intermedius TaxID=433924 RepID=UPI00187D00E8|nr:helix-turn-helix domain-containing protein [Pseudacidovorax intermedius]
MLIALADMANDEGFCWPSIERICERTCYGRTAVIEAIGWLESVGIVRANRTNGRKTTYWVEPDKFAADAAGEPSPHAPNQSATRTGPSGVPVRHADGTSPPRGPVPVRQADTNRHRTIKESKPPLPPAAAVGSRASVRIPIEPRQADGEDAAARAEACAAAADFDALVAVYPRRKAIERARRQWLALAPDAALRRVILAAVRAQVAGDEWRRLRREGRDHLIPMLSTWLHGRRWTDEVSKRLADEGSPDAWDATRSSIEAVGVSLGLGRWDQRAFEAGRGKPFPAYAATVRRAREAEGCAHAR